MEEYKEYKKRIIEEISWWSYHRLEKDFIRIERIFNQYEKYKNNILQYEIEKIENRNEKSNEKIENDKKYKKYLNILNLFLREVLYTLKEIKNDLLFNIERYECNGSFLYLGTVKNSEKMAQKIATFISRAFRMQYKDDKVFKYIKNNIIKTCKIINEEYYQN